MAACVTESVRAEFVLPIPGGVRVGLLSLLEAIPTGAGVSAFAQGSVGQCSICGVPSGNSADNPFLPTSLAA